MTGDYRKDFIRSVNYLVQVRHGLFDEAMNLAMLGDLRDINDAFEVGDTYTFELAHLQNSADSNVNALVSLIEEIQGIVDSLVSVNNIDRKEIEWELKQPDSDDSPRGSQKIFGCARSVKTILTCIKSIRMMEGL
ncbi:MAG: hypothetical protein OEV74_17465 [Cyclobacteriaceae bacterium]|nr:hypothetical protein [Cyclobacteriaceae bacterium]MDH4298070.1 hypothetical protein [Cyclobacteriaceae bacterium]MDH5250015.1 hypothetical protein [Cyclobacteriaceae bacterium]